MYDPGMFWAVFGAAWVFGFVIVSIVIWNLRSKRRIEKMQIVHEERMKAMEKGVPLPEFPDIDEDDSVEKFKILFGRSRVNPKWPLGLGILFVMSGIGYIVAMLLSADSELWKLWSMGMIGVFFGLGLMLFYALTRSPQDNSGSD